MLIKLYEVVRMGVLVKVGAEIGVGGGTGCSDCYILLGLQSGRDKNHIGGSRGKGGLVF